MSTPGSVGRFVDYFVISGLDVSSGLEPDLLSGDNFHCPPLIRPYKSKVIAHYPESVSWNPFDKEAVGLLSLPKGVSFRTQKEARESKFHSFIITKEDGSRSAGASFVFYEEVKDRHICAAMQTLQDMHVAELSNAQSRTMYTRDGNIKQKSLAGISYDMDRDKMYVTKSITVLLQHAYVGVCRHFLKQLQNIVTRERSESLALETYVYNLLYEVPVLPSGRSMKLFGPTYPIFCQRPGINELPLMDFSLWEVFQLLGMENVLQVLVSMMLEHQILLYSTDYQRLMMVAEAITSLLFPFSWQHVYVPILPASMLHFLDAPVPYIMGLHRGMEHESELALPVEATMCFVDIDAGKVELPEDLPSFPHHQDLLKELVATINNYEFSLSPVTESPAHNQKYIDSPVHSPRKTNTPDIQTERHNSPSRSHRHSPLQPHLRTSSPSHNSSRIPTKLQNKSPSHGTKEMGGLDSIKHPANLEILQQSEAWTRISAIAKKTGVWDTIEGLSDNTDRLEKVKGNKERATMPSKELSEVLFNNAIRQLFFNRFVHMLYSYEVFVIQPAQNMESWINNRETMQNFDKAAFLSDHPETYLPFLSPFIETQMFATFIDNKILSHWEDADPYLIMFDLRIKTLKESTNVDNEPQAQTYTKCDTIEETGALIDKRAKYIDHVSPRPHAIEMSEEPAKHDIDIFPILSQEILNTEHSANKPKVRESAKWRRNDRLLQHSQHIQLNSKQREKYIQEARTKSVCQPKLSESSASVMVQTNWKFVKTLLSECKTKTKRMLVEKMGQEAVELGHGEVNITGIEENTLIASLCDFLERIWSHGMQSKKGKSALWSHMLSYLEKHEPQEAGISTDLNMLSPVMATMSIGSERAGRTHRRTRSKGGLELPSLTKLPKSLIYDMKCIQKMGVIRTDVGCARAFVRLSLEKKLLSSHLKELLADTDLLKFLYKRYAFLRCEDEREQFLYHLLSLNAVDYFCFTNSFVNTVMPYRVLIFPSAKFGCSTTSANTYVGIAGQLGETGIIELEKGALEICKQNKNLGILTTLKIGHDNSGMMPKWVIEHVLVRNEVTGHVYKFPCGRWLGKGVDDGSTERLLVAELLPPAAEAEDIVSYCKTPPRRRSPSTPRKHRLQEISAAEVQEMLGHAVNNIVKYFYKPEKERGNLTFLLCGENGLVPCMEMVFQSGFKSSRLFRNKFFIWDYVEKVRVYFEMVLEADGSLSTSDRSLYLMYCGLLNKINGAGQSIGKDGKFQLFVCVGIRDHFLQLWIPLMTSTPVTAHMFEDFSYLRDASLTNFLVHILDALNEFPITLEASLIRGLDI